VEAQKKKTAIFLPQVGCPVAVADDPAEVQAKSTGMGAGEGGWSGDGGGKMRGPSIS